MGVGIAHLFQIGHQPRPGRVPCQLFPGLRAGGRNITTHEGTEPTKMGRGLFRRYGNQGEPCEANPDLSHAR